MIKSFPREAAKTGDWPQRWPLPMNQDKALKREKVK
jgi:hypothetical protein